MRRLFLLIPLALAATACGGSGTSSTALYLPGPTAACLRDHGFKVSTRERDLALVIATADLGGLHAWRTKAGNQLQIAFAGNRQGARDQFVAIKRVAPKTLRPHILDVTRVKRNAVVLWTVAPKAEDDQIALDCLGS